MRFAESLDAGFRLLRFSPGVSVGTAMIVLTLFLLAVGAAVAGLIWLSFGYVIGIAGNTEAAGGLSFESFRLAWTLQYAVWALAVAGILITRRKARRLLALQDDRSLLEGIGS